MIEAAPILPREAFGFDADTADNPDTDYQPGGEDAKVVDDFGELEGDDAAPGEPKITILSTPSANHWDQVRHEILQHEKAAVHADQAKRIVKVTVPDVPGRPDFADGTYSGFHVEPGPELILHFNDGTKIKP